MKKLSYTKFYLSLAVIAGLLAAAAIRALGWNPAPYALWLISTSLVSFALYGHDKFQGSRGGGRIPEAVLHLLALSGGFAGGWLGRVLFRHKTRKTRFLFILILATLLHAVPILRMVRD